jgi:hypothetical protein
MDNTIVRGNSTDPGNPLGPIQATIIPFSRNTNPDTPGGQLRYNYTMDKPAQLQAIVTNPTAGAVWSDVTANNFNQRFYRVQLLP